MNRCRWKLLEIIVKVRVPVVKVVLVLVSVTGQFTALGEIFP